MKVALEVSPEILAKYNGRCCECNAAMRKGETIVEVIATGAYVHPECVPVQEVRW